MVFVGDIGRNLKPIHDKGGAGKVPLVALRDSLFPGKIKPVTVRLRPLAGADLLCAELVEPLPRAVPCRRLQEAGDALGQVGGSLDDLSSGLVVQGGAGAQAGKFRPDCGGVLWPASASRTERRGMTSPRRPLVASSRRFRRDSSELKRRIARPSNSVRASMVPAMSNSSRISSSLPRPNLPGSCAVVSSLISWNLLNQSPVSSWAG